MTAAVGTRRGLRSAAARLRTVAGLVIVAAAVATLVPAQALAVDPETVVGGSGSKWFSGTWLQQSGNNCSVLGNPYSETMVSAIAGYGGAPGGQVVKVGDRYYASLLVSIPGNPCGSGSAIVGTDLVLPRGTSVDTSAPIRCFGQPRLASTFGELTGGSWSFMGSSGAWCPAQVSGSLTGTSGAVGVGYRPLANGQLFHLFVPIKSTQTLQGAGASPVDEVRWVLRSSGTYANQGATSVWANVFPAGSTNAPFIYFARNPSVVPFWANGASPGQQNQAEWFANLYSAGLPGTFCWELHDGPTATDPAPLDCSSVSGWNGTVTNLSDSWQVFGDGPNGGFVPFAYNISTTYTIRWRFTPNVGTPVSRDISFTTLPGPDTDGDGVPNTSDACPSVAGTLSNGCQPAVQSDPDGDGVFGSADRCPSQNGGSAPNGCPPATPPPADPDGDGDGVTASNDKCPTVAASTPDGCPVLALTASLGKIKENKLKRSALVKGVSLSISCGLDSKASATLWLSRAVAKKLKIAVKRKQTKVTVGSARGNCTAAAGGRPKLKLKRALVAKIRKPRKAVAATLVVVFTRAGSKAVTVRRAVKLT